MKGDPSRDGVKGAEPVWEMACIFPKEVSDEWFRCVSVASCLEKEMFEFSHNAADIKNPIGLLCALQIDGDYIEPFAKEKIAWGRIAVH